MYQTQSILFADSDVPPENKDSPNSNFGMHSSKGSVPFPETYKNLRARQKDILEVCGSTLQRSWMMYAYGAVLSFCLFLRCRFIIHHLQKTETLLDSYKTNAKAVFELLSVAIFTFLAVYPPIWIDNSCTIDFYRTRLQGIWFGPAFVAQAVFLGMYSLATLVLAIRLWETKGLASPSNLRWMSELMAKQYGYQSLELLAVLITFSFQAIEIHSKAEQHASLSGEFLLAM
jgi:hypothetical protein